MSARRALLTTRALLVGAAFALALLHGGLLWQRIAEGSLLQPMVLARWIGGSLLVVALVALQRARGSVFAGRPGVALWAMVLLLHLLAGVPAADAVDVDLVLPLGALTTMLWIAVAALVTLALSAAAEARPARQRASRRGRPAAWRDLPTPVGRRGPPPA